jgi:hypothetical protein
MKGAHSVIEDFDGNITEISFYGLVDPVTPKALNRVIPKGTHVIIVDPFFKMRQDGTAGIRVDDPDEVIFGDELPIPKSAAEFKEEAAKLYKAGNYKEAIFCFEKELEFLVTSSDLILLTLLSNSALCFSKASDEPKALLFAFGASVVGENCKSLDGKKLLCKVYFRIFNALKTIGGATEEATFVSNLIKDFDPKFWSEMVDLRATASRKKPNKEKSLVNILRMCVVPLLQILKQDKTEIRKGASDEKEHRL